jgi:hypothetical protein
VVGVAAADLLIRLAPRVRRGYGLLEYLDHLGPQGMTGVKTVLRRALKMRRQIAGEGW